MLTVYGEIYVTKLAGKVAEVKHVTNETGFVTCAMTDTGDTDANMNAMQGAMEHVTS